MAQESSPKIESIPDWRSQYLEAIPYRQTIELKTATEYCSCVEYIKQLLGRQGEVWGWAGNMKPDHFTPQVGDIVITSEGNGHIGLVIGVSATEITIKDANYKHCQKTIRTLPINSPLIKGYKLPY